MKILVAAKRIAADRTSEGICSSKYLTALGTAGHEVVCLSPDVDALTRVQRRQAGVRLIPSTALAQAGPRHMDSVRASGLAALVTRKAQALGTYATGYSRVTWNAVSAWHTAIHDTVTRERPDVIVVRGAGREFEPHMAMLKWQAPVPWVAHYHDPYPGSLYPEPYRQRIPILSARQERVHRTILERCDALTFPSRRLLEWVLDGDLARYREKAFVVPHIAGGVPYEAAEADGSDEADLETGRLNVLHTGTLLKERDPRALLRGFMAFVGADPDRRRLARLVFVGRVDEQHTGGEWELLRRDGLLRTVERRVSYRAAMRLAQAADCLAIVEANAEVSPFFPAKLADYVSTGKPILALSPDASTTADLLGREYPLRIAPADTTGAAMAFERIWTAWQAGRLGALAPPPSLAASLSDAVVRQETERMLNTIVARPVEHVA